MKTRVSVHCKNETDDRMTTEFLLHKEKKIKKLTHKTAHLQTAQADTQPMFAKELFSCQRTNRQL